jgi:hypothetical protein
MCFSSIYGVCVTRVLALSGVEQSVMRRAVQVARMGEITNVYVILVGNPEGKRPLEDICHDAWLCPFHSL